MAADNKILGQFNLEGIPPAARGTPQIEVTFDIDVNGIVHVSAKDKASNKEQKVVIQASGGLNEEEIGKMVKDAEVHASEDKKRRETIEIKNKADSLIYSTEKNLKDFNDKISDADKNEIEQTLAALKEVMKHDDLEQIKAKTDLLSVASMKIGEAMYKSDGANDAKHEHEGGNAEDGNDGKVVDASYKDLKEE
jgi:molecular chaperone DnaK